MYYIYLKDNTVLEIIPDVNPAFPGIPIVQRYSSDFLNRCITAEDVSAVHAGMIYDPVAKTFSEPPVPEPVATESTAPAATEPTTEDDILETVLDHEARLANLELLGGTT